MYVSIGSKTLSLSLLLLSTLFLSSLIYSYLWQPKTVKVIENTDFYFRAEPALRVRRDSVMPVEADGWVVVDRAQTSLGDALKHLFTTSSLYQVASIFHILTFLRDLRIFFLSQGKNRRSTSKLERN
jgi:hypothetical protein